MAWENSHFYFFRKPAGLASTWGRERCFLNDLEEGKYVGGDFSYLQSTLSQEVYEVIHTQLTNLNLVPVQDVQRATTHLLHTFLTTQEYGLLNRLDSETSGLLYFAKDHETLTQYREQQKLGNVVKHYIAKVKGRADWMIHHGVGDRYYLEVEGDRLHIRLPIMHHKHLNDRMVVLPDPEYAEKGRGNILTPTTSYQVLSYDLANNESLLHLTITKGVRHQIRSHLAGIGYPILGEKLYASLDVHHAGLCLWSVGMQVG